MNAIWTILDVLNWTTNYFKSKKIPNSRLDAELIISHCLRIKRLELYLKFDQPLEKSERNLIKGLVKRRGRREPLQYLFGEVEFYNCKFEVNPSVLIPRPETEYMVEMILNDKFSPKSILDLCTGSGAIAISLKKEMKNVLVTASDISVDALKTAENNAIKNEVKIKFIQSDLFGNIDDKFDLIVSNPPYVDKTIYENLEPEIFFEPKIALIASEKGLGIYKSILDDAHNYLNKRGVLFFEIGDEQASEIKNYAELRGFKNIKVIEDLNGKDRIMRMEND